MTAEPLTDDDERELARRIRSGDEADREAARHRLVLAHLGVAVEIARRVHRGRLPIDDAIQEGNLGLMRASEDFDPDVHGCRFATYAEIWVGAFIRRAIIREQWPIYYPQACFSRSPSPPYSSLSADLIHEQTRPPGSLAALTACRKGPDGYPPGRGPKTL